ncbi:MULTISPECIES: tannase/feruloyl esterase family alpha/beta hydrolase [Paraburkholderia]|uniref:tannase/feruloyl esterase family alpha/beta hydrolase n=1 Tax=Paraburkholderia TaxID=1822464 RepID=UPI00321874C8
MYWNNTETMVKKGPKVVLHTFACAAAIFSVGGCGGIDETPASNIPAPVVSNAERCQQLAKMVFPIATFTTVGEIHAGDFTAPDTTIVKNLPEFCRVAASLTPSSDSNIRVEVWMPAEGWNGKYLGLGNGGYAGLLDYPSLGAGISRGYAVAHTDMGTYPATSFDGKPLMGHPEKWIDWGYRSTHLMTMFAKAVAQQYYSAAPTKSYFMGCSTGGGQAIHEATQYPADYDGVIVGAPANDRIGTHIGIATSWELLTTKNGGVPAAKLNLLYNEVVSACDSLDGVTDGIISQPDQCKFNPATLQCKGADAANCLTASQVGAIEALYAGVSNSSTGETIYPPFKKGSEQQWLPITFFPGPVPPFGDLFNWVLGANFSFETFDYVNDTATMNSVLGPILNATSPDLTTFKSRGGKIIAFNGLADPLIPAGGLESYLEKVAKSAGDSRSFVRLFEVPGMGHCSGGIGVNKFGSSISTDAPFPGDSSRDLLAALDKWADSGAAPDRIVATKFADDDQTKGVVTRTFPLCPYPQVAKYDGHGDISQESSYTCGSPS